MSACRNCTSPTTGAAPALFASAINVLLASQLSLIDNFKSDKIRDGDKFHFIVVGAGSAGCVVARRLSEIKEWNILLLEAGLRQPIESYVPLFADNLTGTKYDWQYSTIDNRKANRAFKNGRVQWPRGKMLGGTSSLNSMNYVRGSKEDFEIWKNAGNPSWTTKNVYAHFKKAESFQNQKLRENLTVRNTYGHIGPQILNRFNSTQRPIHKKVMKSLNEIGFEIVADVNTVEFKSPGVTSFTTVTAANGQRYSTYQSYLQPIRERKNLKIVTRAFVTRVLINRNKQAYGVEVDICNKRIKVYSDLEVILSAGTISTPQLLLLSGVGPKKHLESKNISCIVNLNAVGKNLQDHIVTPVPIYTDTFKVLSADDLTFETIKYLYNRTGLLAGVGNNKADIRIFFANNLTATYPDYQAYLILFNKNSTTEISKQFSFYNETVLKSFTESVKYKSAFYFFLNLLHPMSRGEILLNTSNPYDKPLIDPNFFSNPLDLQSASTGIRILTKIVNTTYFRSTNASLHRIKVPECDKFILNSKEYWECQIKNTAFSAYHAIGTAKMGPNASDSVVDNNLKVHIVNSLRIIDASIMPTLPSGNIYSPTIMIAEMGSSMIKSHYNV